MTKQLVAIFLSLSVLMPAAAQSEVQTDSVKRAQVSVPEASLNTRPFTSPDSPVPAGKLSFGKSLSRFVDNHYTLMRFGALPMAVTGTWYGTYRTFDSGIMRESQEHRHLVADHSATILEPLGRGIVWVPGFTSMFLYGTLAKDKKAQKAAVVGLGAFYANSVATYHLKTFFNRHRPNSGADHNTWGGPGNASGNHHSFPSAHTSTAFCAATVLASVYRDKPLVPIMAYTMASMVGMSRIYQNHHWASDVMAGALVGFATAKGSLAVYNWADRKWQQHRRKKSHLMVTPQASLRNIGLTATLAF